MVEYGQALELQRALARARIEGEVGDLLLLLEHPPTITLGRGGDRGHLLVDDVSLKSKGIAFFEVERGGGITYHGPGQLVGYPILDLSLHGRDLHLYVRKLEEVLIKALLAFGIQAERVPGLPGVWAGSRKITSLGLHIKRWVSWHGFALNVNVDLAPFRLIIPCGLREVEMTSMAELLGRKVPMEAVEDRVVASFQEVFQIEAQEGSLEPFPPFPLPGLKAFPGEPFSSITLFLDFPRNPRYYWKKLKAPIEDGPHRTARRYPL